MPQRITLAPQSADQFNGSPVSGRVTYSTATYSVTETAATSTRVHRRKQLWVTRYTTRHTARGITAELTHNVPPTMQTVPTQSLLTASTAKPPAKGKRSDTKSTMATTKKRPSVPAVLPAPPQRPLVPAIPSQRPVVQGQGAGIVTEKPTKPVQRAQGRK
ncbi:hypothetical protein OBBRIDRAFT_828216 [Obba rivulosa]|uniref:Uncharacterized protein n=1 Tax=Obba rivulosa TaxID=1052685 RepID=A0A8E2AL92_9APHY|nr:hypothetical protein OBBRIDRAFT_828216 [Obba rivulosa]